MLIELAESPRRGLHAGLGLGALHDRLRMALPGRRVAEGDLAADGTPRMRTPSLRDVARTAPSMRNAQLEMG